MAQQEGKQALIIQLPWTVPQQPNVQTIVLQQPAKTQMELNASTDKTAISSFGLSVLIAVILGLFATWLAYWYGRKSFKLTEMSFKTVSEDIKQAAETHRITTDKVLNNQKMLKEQELQFLYRSSEIDKFRNVIAEYFALLMKFNSVVSLEIGRMERGDLIESLINYLSQVAYYHMQIELFLDCEANSHHQAVKTQMKELMDSLWKIRIQLDGNKDQLNDRIAAFSNELDVVKASLIKLLNQNVKLQKAA